MLALLVLREMGEDEPCRVDIEPSQRIFLTDKLVASVETGSPRRVDEYVATFRHHAKPHMFLKRAVRTDVRRPAALAVDKTGFDTDRLTKTIEKFAVALAHGLALAPCFVGSANRSGTVEGDIVANPKVNELGLFVLRRSRSYDTAGQRRIVVVGTGDVIVGGKYGTFPTR